MGSSRDMSLDLLISRYLDGDLDKDGVAQLEQRLASDPAAIDKFVELSTAHTDLVENHSPLTEPAELLSRSLASADLPSRAVPDRNSASSRLRSVAWNGAIAIAASLLTFVAFQDWDGSGEPEKETGAFAARVLRKIDCDWEIDNWEVSCSDRVFAGQTISVTRGLMELEFASGALVTLEGPVTFGVESGTRGVVFEGKLTADVPESARGFTVATPAGEAIDLGTNFGIEVAGDGTTETHVFQGEVIMRPHKSAEVRLTDDMALELNAGGDVARRMSALPQGFVRSSFSAAPHALQPAVDRDLALWLAADGPVQVDEDGNAVAWGDVASSSNRTSEHAWQVSPNRRPRWVANSLNGKPVLRFAGRHSLVTEPMSIGENITIAVVARTAQGAHRRTTRVGHLGQQLINLNGPPHLAMTITPEGRLLGRAYLGLLQRTNTPSRHVRSGELSTADGVDGRALLFVYVYDSDLQVSKLYCNANEQASAAAKSLGPTHTPRHIGSHSLHGGTGYMGDIAELMIFDAALTEVEVTLLSAELMEKYGLREGKEGE